MHSFIDPFTMQPAKLSKLLQCFRNYYKSTRDDTASLHTFCLLKLSSGLRNMGWGSNKERNIRTLETTLTKDS